MNLAAPAARRPPFVVGREPERARIEAFAAALHEGPLALVIRGEPGIGKTALWSYAVEHCRRAGFNVLLTRPAEEEMRLALVGLVDLFENVELDTRSLLADDSPFARGRAVLDALRSLAAATPTVVAVDDLPWIDSVSARALRFALRRLDAEPIGLLVTARFDSDADDLLAAPSALPPGRYETLDLGPLDLGSLRRVLRGIVATISRPMLRRIHEISGGNPLYAIELARALSTHADAFRSPSGVPLPDSLRAAIEGRLQTVPPELSPLLETAAILGPTSVKELSETLPEVDVDGLLGVAEALGLLVVEADLQVRFSHPVIESAVYGRMSTLRRRSLHAHIASRAVNLDVRARHLALSTDAADPAVAELLEEAAERASGRGASDLAAEFARHSLRLTPLEDGDAARRRALAEVVHLAAAGEASRALALADRLVATLPHGPGRAEALVQRFFVEDDNLEVGDRLLMRALEDTGEDELLRGRVLDTLGWLRGLFRGDLRGGIQCAREAVEIADRVGDGALQMLTAGHLAHMEWLAGMPRPDAMAKAVALADKFGGPRLGGGPRAWLAKQLFWAGDLPSARGLFEAVHADDIRSGNELERPYRLYDLALVECASGNFESAAEVVRGGMEAAQDAGNVDAEGWLLYPLGVVEAWLGRGSEARAAAEELLEWTRKRGGLPWVVRAKSVLGVLGLAQGKPEAAAVELLEAARLLDDMGFAHPGALPVLPDAIEALTQSGDVLAAEALFERLERQAGALDSPWVRAAAARCRGVLLLARGRTDAAAEILAESVASFEGLRFRPDAARAVLAHGRALLRGGRRVAAADRLAEAQSRFAVMGASLWELRAAEELERAAPGRATGELTETEGRIAGLVAQGLRNREIAAALFMGMATVEAHLTRIYRKLGIRSRSELTRLVADGRVPGASSGAGPEAGAPVR